MDLPLCAFKIGILNLLGQNETLEYSAKRFLQLLESFLLPQLTADFFAR